MGGVPEGYAINWTSKPLINPRLELAIVPRKVTWESGIQNSAKSRLGPGKDSEQSMVTGSSKRYKTAITVDKIIVLIKTQELDSESQNTPTINELFLGDLKLINMGTGVGTLRKKNNLIKVLLIQLNW